MNAMTSFLESIQIGEPVSSGSVFMFPLLSDRTTDRSPLTLDEALKLNLVEIDETSFAGSVPEIVVENHATEPVFLLDGEQVLGLKQNRTFNLSMLLEPKSRTMVPVSCLEAGRWSRGSTNVRSAEHVHFASGRASKLRSVSESIRRDGTYHSDQSTVWRDISRKFEATQERSSTSAEADFYSSRRQQLEELGLPLGPRPNQIGAVIGIGDRVIGIDAFLTTELYQSLHSKVLKSYLLDAVECKQAAAAPSRDWIFRKVRAVFSGEPTRSPAPGCGQALRWLSLDGTAAALVHKGRCIHAVAFCTEGESDEDYVAAEVA